jgi:MFS family permease
MSRSKLFRPALLSVSLLTIMAGAAVAPALGQISRAFPDSDPTLIKMITTLPALLIIVASLLSGQLARVMAKRTLLIVGLLLYLVGGLAGGFATSILMLLAFRGVLGLGVGIISPLSLTLVADFFSGETRSRYMGYSTAVSSLGGSITTIAAGWLAATNWRYAFGVYVLAIGVLALVVLALPEPPRTQEGSRSTTRLPMRVYGLALLGLLVMLGFYVVPTTTALFLQNEGFGDAGLAGLAFAVLTFCSFLAGLGYSRIAQRLRSWTPVAGVVLFGGGMWVLSGSRSFPVVLVGMVLVGLGIAVTQPSLVVAVANLVPQADNSRALSLFSGAGYLGQFLSAIVFAALGGLFADPSPRFSFRWSAIGFSVAAAVIVLALVRRGRTPSRA